jgi:hypothetical protein
VRVGSEDDLFYPDRFASLIHTVRPDMPVIIVPGVTHMGMVTDPRALSAVANAIERRAQPKLSRGARLNRIGMESIGPQNRFARLGYRWRVHDGAL